jgi:hypothetical protein
MYKVYRSRSGGLLVKTDCPQVIVEPLCGTGSLSRRTPRFIAQKTIRRPEKSGAGGCLLLTCSSNYVATIRGVMKKMSSWLELLTD